MKGLLAGFLAVLLLMPAAYAAGSEYPYQVSPWAEQEVERAMRLGLEGSSYNWDLRTPIMRGDFAQRAVFLVSVEFNTDLDSYLDIMSYRKAPETGNIFAVTALDVAKDLGIIQGRGEDDWDSSSYITRQEAAVMLARTYRAYHGEEVERFVPTVFSDEQEIADWAMDDVELMNDLGIMTGVGDGKFDPLGIYTTEQCFITLLRLHEKMSYDGSVQKNPLAISKPQAGFVRHWKNNGLVFAMETEEYYIYAWSLMGTPGGASYHIEIIDQDLHRRSYSTGVVTAANCLRGERYAEPENAVLSADGSQLIYAVTLREDVYYNGFTDQGPPMQQKGIYTVTMDLKTGEQTIVRADLPQT